MELWWLMADSQANPQCTAFVQETWVAWQPHPWAHEGGDWGKEDVEEIMRMRVCITFFILHFFKYFENPEYNFLNWVYILLTNIYFHKIVS